MISNQTASQLVTVNESFITTPVFTILLEDAEENVSIYHYVDGEGTLLSESAYEISGTTCTIDDEAVTLTINDILAVVRNEDFVQQSTFSTVSGLEDALDSIVKMIQQVNEEASRAIKADHGSEPESYDFDMLGIDWDGRVVCFDTAGTAAVVSTSDLQSAISALTNISEIEDDIDTLEASVADHESRLDSQGAAIEGKQDTLTFTPERQSNKGVAGGYAGLDSNGELLKAFAAAALKNSVFSYSDYNSIDLSDDTKPDSYIAYVVNDGDIYIYIVINGSKIIPFYSSTLQNLETSLESVENVGSGTAFKLFPNNNTIAIIGTGTVSIINLTTLEVVETAALEPSDIQEQDEFYMYRSGTSYFVDSDLTPLFNSYTGYLGRHNDLYYFNESGTVYVFDGYDDISPTTLTYNDITGSYSNNQMFWNYDYTLNGWWRSARFYDGVDYTSNIYFYDDIEEFISAGTYTEMFTLSESEDCRYLYPLNYGKCLIIGGSSYRWYNENGEIITNLPISASDAYNLALAGELYINGIGQNPVTGKNQITLSYEGYRESGGLVGYVQYYLMDDDDYDTLIIDEEYTTDYNSEYASPSVRYNGVLYVIINSFILTQEVLADIPWERISGAPDFALDAEMQTRFEALEDDSHVHSNKTILDGILAENLLTPTLLNRLLFVCPDISDELALSSTDQILFNAAFPEQEGGVDNVSKALVNILSNLSGVDLSSLESDAIELTAAAQASLDLIDSSATTEDLDDAIDVISSAVSQNESDISALDSRVTQNESDISDNTWDIIRYESTETANGSLDLTSLTTYPVGTKLWVKNLSSYRLDIDINLTDDIPLGSKHSIKLWRESDGWHTKIVEISSEISSEVSGDWVIEKKSNGEMVQRFKHNYGGATPVAYLNIWYSTTAALTFPEDFTAIPFNKSSNSGDPLIHVNVQDSSASACSSTTWTHPDSNSGRTRILNAEFVGKWTTQTMLH